MKHELASLILPRLGAGEAIDVVCEDIGITRADFDAWWHAESAARTPAAHGSIPSSVRGPKLTSRLRTRCRAPSSAGLLCKGISGCVSTSSNCSFFAFVLAIRLSNSSYPVTWLKRVSNA